MRAERVLPEAHSEEVAGLAAASVLVELGNGMARKTGVLLRAISGAPDVVAKRFVDRVAKLLGGDLGREAPAKKAEPW